MRFPLCMAALSLVARAQPGNTAAVRGAAQTAIRTETRMALVDAIVRDNKGKIVSDLKAGDFRLWVDGKAQPVTRLVLGDAGSPDQPEAEYWAFLFDTPELAASAKLKADRDARQDVGEFAGAHAGPNRYMAVMYFDGDLSVAQNFTAAADRVQRAAGDAARAASWGPHAHGGGRDAIANAVGTIAQWMAGLRGRKSLFLVRAPRGVWDSEPNRVQIAAAVRECNRAGVAAYTTDPRLEPVAAGTGGRLIAGNLLRELDAIAGEGEKRYVLGFKPVESPDGSCHMLRVQTARKGLEVRAPNAYCNAKGPDLPAGKVEGKALEAQDSSPSAGNAAASIELPGAVQAAPRAEAPKTSSDPELEALLAAAREAAVDYAGRLPNFLCTQTVQRFGLFGHLDTLTVEVGYFERQERSRITEVNGRPVDMNILDTKGAISQGEFGANLRTIFDPASDAVFHFERWTTVRGRRAAVYSYRVEPSKADYPITAQWLLQELREQVGLRGEAVIDSETPSVLRLSYSADGISDSFPIRASNVTVDYGDAEIAGSHYLLPLKAVVELRDKLGNRRNEVTFHSYRKFSSESSVSFGEEVPKPQP